MSNEVTVPAFKTKLGNSSAKMVLVLLADVSNSEGFSWPSLRMIQERTELAERTIQRILQVFQEIGLITKIKVKDRTYSVAYQIEMSMLGEDLREQLAERFANAQRPSVCETPSKDVSQTEKGVCETEKGVSQTLPPDPLLGRTIIEPSLNHQRRKPRDEFALPEWIDAYTWEGYVESRGTRHKMTPRARDLILGKLAKWRSQGMNPNEVLEQSILSGWTGVFPVKPEGANLGRPDKFAANAEALRIALGGGPDQGSSGNHGVLQGRDGHTGVPQRLLRAPRTGASAGSP